ncbi:hypothetical protein JGI7_01122 [Candidatus Kryptonium thompsonii]|jgi:hypothetical protein|uniref:Uncharacterized protein n=1 Tax=Candidatus Kryptonium thompsonii TaxID=1633631 RepID=A0A0P1M4Q2_9BACT|nr:hypothetical protein [Candidatus Kryptonium thompsoni]CUS77011.1 hypothetical protein JGI10_00084 [Candidatus Kryptonium thompsoni]CUS80518.1 hypothetical protein JGI15_100830 [Candidatus Kryptonium thompsoni]CUS81562.1 hypothetical protein JGI14_101031 [Candidatus Kryptonium thompsoni]CUS87616.1 hypothetical protein JGI7_01122 [Candidatus Kryptonium thompsoni]CUS89604.1 hypothetical protein JGI12_01275 [Candidatus Kryptonium thompsoni]
MNTAIIFFTSCIIIGYALTEAQGNQYIYDKILDIEKIVIKDKTGEIIDTIKINHKFTLEIYGYLPDPCWEVYKTDLKELKNEFKINPMARRQKAKVCIQVIQPCTVSVDLIAKSTSDTLKISVISKIKTVTKTIKIIQE